MEGPATSTLIFYVNGIKVIETDVDPETSLLHYLRTSLHLPGTKLGCGEGGCGACTVMVSRWNRREKRIHHYAVNACLAPVCAMHGLAVTTVEGIGSTATRLHPVQERLAKSHGSQCGFCTPGFVMSMYTLLRNTPKPSMHELEKTFQGNLCRCTGYRPILDGFRTFTKECNSCPMGEKCCKNNPSSDCSNIEPREPSLTDTTDFAPYDPTQEPIFPSALQLCDDYDQESLVFRGERCSWYRPTTLSAILDLKERFPNAKLVTGNTEVGVEMKLKGQLYPVLISTTHVTELDFIREGEDGIIVGPSTTLATIEARLQQLVRTLPVYQSGVFLALIEMLRWFAGNQIRNVASIGGNIMTASPISDLNPLLQAASSRLTFTSKGGERIVPMDAVFFTGYRQTAAHSDEILSAIHIPFTQPGEYFLGYKQAQRRDDDISIVCAGMRVRLDDQDRVEHISLSYGGMAPTTVLARRTMNTLTGMAWDETLLERGATSLASELALPGGVPGGMEAYRQTLALSFFFKFYVTVCHQRCTNSVKKNNFNEMLDVSAIGRHEREHSRGSQVFEIPTDLTGEHDVIGLPIMHSSACLQVTGEAVYVDDIPSQKGELYLALVTSSKAHAKITSLDASEALRMPGVVELISHRDVPGSNITGAVFKDEEIFATDKVVYHGQAIGAILADTQAHAQRAARRVHVEYEELPAIITIQQAIEAKSFFESEVDLSLGCGDVMAGFQESDHVIEGEAHIGGQEHFYLETQATLACPRDRGELEIFSSCQSPSEAQALVANALGVASHKIQLRVKRIGGAFGGKQTDYRLILIPVALAATKARRPVRCQLDRDEDMALTGNRNPFLGKYKVGFSKDGRVLALDLQLYVNAGHSCDLSQAVLEKALFTVENCYKIPHVRVTGTLCRTNLPSSTAFRAFGAPQALFICETWMDHVATVLGMPKEHVREVNLYQTGDANYYGDVMTDCNIRRCWSECVRMSDYFRRKQNLETSNVTSRWKKRGIAITPLKFGVAFTELFLNQAGSLVHIYNDGSVLLTHSGTEMGQGLYTKIIQVASRCLQVPMSRIHTSETTTAAVPNMSPSAASASSDLIGMATINACNQLNERLRPYKEAKPQGTWEEWVHDAYFDRVNLSATGFYRTPNIGWNWKTKTGKPYAYYSYGTACTEVEVDCLTGDHSLLRCDIVMDVGKSLNPAIDIGQIEGGFMQGYGLFTLEENKVSPDGVLYSRGPGTYKIPALGDIPSQFNVALLKESPNDKAVYSSKAIGEPPLLLATSAFFAIKDAICAARENYKTEATPDGSHDLGETVPQRGRRVDLGMGNSSGYFRLDSPATAERIRMACPDVFRVEPPAAGTYRPWTVAP